MKTTGLKMMIAAAVILITVISANAGTEEQFVATLKHKHHNQMMTLFGQFLTGQDKAIQRETLKDVIRLELDIAHFVKTADTFYMNRINVPDLDQVPGQLLLLYLSDQGQPMQTAGFFEGKAFTYYE